MMPLRQAYSVVSTFMALNLDMRSCMALISDKACAYLGFSASKADRPIKSHKNKGVN